MIIDADGHLFEGRDLWERYTPAAERDLALSVRDDSRGYPWITLKGESIGRIAWVTVPGHFDYMGEVVSAWRQGLPYPGASYDDLPLDYFDPKARLSSAEGWGVDEVVLYPQAGLLWDRFTGVDLQTARVNMAAWNRRAVEIAQDGGGRIHPVGISRWTATSPGRSTNSGNSQPAVCGLPCSRLSWSTGSDCPIPIMIACGVPFVIWA